MKRPSSPAPWIAVATLVLGAGLALLWSSHRRPAEVKSPPLPLPIAERPAPDPAPQAPIPPSSDPVATHEVTPATPAAHDEAPAASGEAGSGHEQTLEAIQDLAVTYDAASVPPLAKFLSHADPEVRTAARDGLIQLGERAAIPYLEEAARHAAPEEAKALHEAAEFLALPTWTERRAALKAQKKAAP